MLLVLWTKGLRNLQTCPIDRSPLILPTMFSAYRREASSDKQSNASFHVLELGDRIMHLDMSTMFAHVFHDNVEVSYECSLES